MHPLTCCPSSQEIGRLSFRILRTSTVFSFVFITRDMLFIFAFFCIIQLLTAHDTRFTAPGRLVPSRSEVPQPGLPFLSLLTHLPVTGPSSSLLQGWL